MPLGYSRESSTFGKHCWTMETMLVSPRFLWFCSAPKPLPRPVGFVQQPYSSFLFFHRMTWFLPPCFLWFCNALLYTVAAAMICVFPCSVDLWTPSSQAYPSCNASRDALGGLTIVATLAHELYWTCDYREDPRCCAADCRCLCPFNRWAMCAYCLYECLRAATSNTGSCIATSCFCRACPYGHVTSTLKCSWRCLVSLAA